MFGALIGAFLATMTTSIAVDEVLIGLVAGGVIGFSFARVINYGKRDSDRDGDQPPS